MGTSAGALAGSLYCAGFSAEQVSHAGPDAHVHGMCHTGAAQAWSCLPN